MKINMKTSITFSSNSVVDDQICKWLILNWYKKGETKKKRVRATEQLFLNFLLMCSGSCGCLNSSHPVNTWTCHGACCEHSCLNGLLHLPAAFSHKQWHTNKHSMHIKKQQNRGLSEPKSHTQSPPQKTRRTDRKQRRVHYLHGASPPPPSPAHISPHICWTAH